MIRPYVCAGTTIIISLAVFNLLGFECSAVVFGVSIFLTAVLYFIRNKNKVVAATFVCTLSLLVSSSVFCVKIVTDYLPSTLLNSDAERTVSGVLCEYEKQNDSYYYTIKDVTVDGVQTDEKIRVRSNIFKRADIDDTLTFSSAVIYQLGESSGNSGYYKAEGIYSGAYTYNDFTVTKAEKHSVSYYLNEMRAYIEKSLYRVENKKYSAVLAAMLTGDQSELDDDTLMNFRYSGIAHLFAVSGFHLTVWTSAISVFFDKLFKKKKRISAAASILFVIFFMALTGFTKSVVRAGIMMLIMLTGKLIKYRSDPLNSLFIAAAIILLINPFSIMSISLQLSFLATLGILLLSKPIMQPVRKLKEKIKSKHIYKSISFVYSGFMIALTASLFTLPVSALNFGYISLWSPVTNVLCMFAAELAMILSATAVIFSPLAAISKPILILSTLITRYIVFITDTISSLRTAIVDTSSALIQISLIVVIILMMIFLIVFKDNDKHMRKTLYLSAVAAFSIYICAFEIQSDSVKITVADVGNGTSLLLDIGDKNVMIGCGGSKYKGYKLTSAADNNNTMNYDLLIVPRENDTESLYMYTVLDRYSFDSCIIYSRDIPLYMSERLPENTYCTAYCEVNLDENCDLVYINNDDFTGVRIESEKFSCTIIFRPGVDFSSVPDEWQSGSLLIARQTLPDIDLSGFENIILSSSSDIIYINKNIYTTSFGGQIVYRMYPFALTTVTEEHNDYK